MKPRYKDLIAALLAIAIGTVSGGFATAQMTTPHGPRGDENVTNSGGAGTGDGKRRSHTMPAIELESDKPPLKLSEIERGQIAEAISHERTYQRAPEDFEPKIGLTVRKEIKLNPMPRPLIYEIPTLRQYDYAKLRSTILVIDPMSLKIVDVIPRKYPTVGKPMSPMEWWSTRGRELVGLPAEPISGDAPAATRPQENRGDAPSRTDKNR